jgi:hypothetical protein
MSRPVHARILALAALLISSLGLTALAADESGQKPPVESEPASDADCVADSGGFRMDGNTPTYVVALENKCEKRLRCKVYASVMTAKGNAQGHATLTLAPHAQGAKAKQAYVLKVKSMGGIAQSSRECKAL